MKKAKEWYHICLRKAGDLSIEPLPFTKSDHEGFPRVLSFVKYSLTDPNLQRRRAALTVMQFYKLYPVRGEYSLDSITSPSAVEKYPPEFIQEYEVILERMFPSDQLSQRIGELSPDFHLSGRNGPNGPMLGTAHVDREAIRGTQVLHHVRRLASATYNYNLGGVLGQTERPCTVTHTSGKSPQHSVIRIKYEPGGKMRPFAIVDFFSQSALKPIHKFLMNYLERQPQDGSKSHSDAAFAVKEWTRSHEMLWSFDLTSATDRWPLSLIVLMMEKALGPEIAECWKNVITDRTFIGPKGEEVRWAVGQPLGALSSWAAFAISHHAFIQTCERLCWLDNKRLAPRKKLYYRKPASYYRMIGDDITITRYPEIAAKYESYLYQFGLKISLSKSVVPGQYPSSNSSAELAKRLFTNGYEVTPVPPDAILEYSKPYGIRALLESSLNRGYQSAGSPYAVQSTHLSLGEWRLLTFPFRNALPQLNGVKSLFPYWEGGEDAPAGLNPNWFFWFEIPEEHLRSLLYDYIVKEARKAELESVTLIRSLSFTMGPVSPLAKLPQGGNWHPGPAGCHPQVILTVLREVSMKLMEVQMSFGDPNLAIEDLYRTIGSFHLFLEPKLLIQGRKALDEKQSTRLFMSKVVKYCLVNKDRVALEAPM